MEPALSPPGLAKASVGLTAGLDIMRLLNRGKWHILAGVVLGMVAGYVYCLRTPPMYRSYGQLFLQPRLSNSDLMAATNGNAGMLAAAEEHSLQSRLTTYAYIFASPKVVAKALEAKDSGIDELPAFRIDPNTAAGRVMANLKADRVVERGTEPTSILSVSYASLDPVESRLVLKAVIKAFRDFVTQADVTDNTQKREKAEQFSRTLDSDREKLQKELRRLEVVFDSDEKLAAVQKPSPGDPTPPSPITARMFQNAEREEVQANELLLLYQNRKLDFERSLKAIEQGLARKDRPEVLLQAVALLSTQRDGDAGSKQGVDPLMMRLVDIDAELKMLDADNVGKTRPQRMRLEEMKKNLLALQDVNSAAMGGSDPKEVLAKFEAVRRAAAAALPAIIADQKIVANQASEVASQVRGRRGDMQVLKDRIAAIDKQLEGVRNSRRAIDLEAGSGIRVEEMSPPGDGEAQSILVRSLQLGALGGLLLGLLVAYLFEVSDQSFRSAEEIQQTLGVKLLGHVSTFRPARPGEEQAVPEGSAAPDSSLVSFYRPKSRIAEDYRAVRTALMYGLGGDGRKVIQVTSPNPGDGKSTLCANLAVAIARTGKRVALVDVDWRRPRVEKIFSLDNRHGVTNVLRGEALLDDALQASCVENLSVIPCGLPKPENPAEMLVGEGFAALLEELRRRFDFVLLDTPPVLAVSDPCSVAPLADGVVMTLNINTRSRADAVRAAEQLEDVGAKLVGVVVNRVAAVVGYGDYGYQGYAYGTEYYGRSNAYYTDDEADGRAKPNGRPKPAAAVLRSAEPPRPPEAPKGPAAKADAPMRPPSSMDDLLRGLRQKFGEVPAGDAGAEPRNGDQA